MPAGPKEERPSALAGFRRERKRHDLPDDSRLHDVTSGR